MTFEDQPTLTSVGGHDMFVARISASDGHTIWAKSFGNSTQQQIADIVSNTSGRIWVAGTYSGELQLGAAVTLPAPVSGGAIFVAELDGNGDVLWAQKYSDDVKGTASVSRIGLDLDNNVILAGEYAGELTFWDKHHLPNLDGDTFYVAKIATTTTGAGDVWWSKAFTSDLTFIWGMAVDAGGSVSLTGSFRSKLDLGCKTLLTDGDGKFFVRFRP